MSTSTDRCSGATTRAARGCADGAYLRASYDVSAETPDPWTSPQAEANAGTRQSPCYADRRAVGTPAGSAFERTIIAEPDGVHTTGNGRHHNDLMAAFAQRRTDALRDAAFDLQRVAFGPHPRRFDCLLQGHAMVGQVDQRLHGAREDALSAGQAKRIDELAIAQRHHR